VENIRRAGPVQALTGPVARGDAPTIDWHLDALKKLGREEQELYQCLGYYTVKVALEKNSIDSTQAEQLLKTFKGDAAGE